MRVLCVGRHAFLSEHLCRVFQGAGAECEPAVGASEALRKASEFEPHVMVCDGDLITPALLDAWIAEPNLAQLPVLAVSLTRRPEEVSPAELSGLAAVIYLPSLDSGQAAALLAGLHRPRGVSTPSGWRMPAPPPSVHTG
jgi:chemotaxis response regulator CheB